MINPHQTKKGVHADSTMNATLLMMINILTLVLFGPMGRACL
jgi:hypothetical protein